MSTDLEESRSALFAIPPDIDREPWVQAAMGLKAEFGETGRDLWLAWSATGDTYREKDALSVWRSIKADGGVTIRSLFRMALDHGWRPDPKNQGNNITLNSAAPVPPIPVAPAAEHAPQEWSALAQSIWDPAQPLPGTLAETYLHGRGCLQPPPDADCVRFLPARGKYPDSMVALVTNAATNKPQSLHFTYLNPDGTKHSDGKRLLGGHRKAGGCIRLWPDEAVTHSLAIGEGIETMLCAAHGFTPVWATVDAGNMAAFPVLAGIESLTLVADHDDAGIRAARKCAERWAAAGKQVRIALPPSAGTDAADLAVAS
jgi:hypothetical protein